MRCGVVWCGVVSVMGCGVVWFGARRGCVVWCGVAQRVVQRGVVWCGAVRCAEGWGAERVRCGGVGVGLGWSGVGLGWSGEEWAEVGRSGVGHGGVWLSEVVWS